MKFNILRISFLFFAIAIFYSLCSLKYLESDYSLNLKLTRNIYSGYDFVVYPIYYCTESIKGLSDKNEYKKIIDIGLEEDNEPLKLSCYRFSVFYDNYRNSIINPNYFGDDLRDSYASKCGNNLGMTLFSRFLNQSLINNGFAPKIVGSGFVVCGMVNEKIDAILVNSVSEFRNKILKLCK